MSQYRAGHTSELANLRTCEFVSLFFNCIVVFGESVYLPIYAFFPFFAKRIRWRNAQTDPRRRASGGVLYYTPVAYVVFSRNFEVPFY